jgi:hypothetical protein
VGVTRLVRIPSIQVWCLALLVFLFLWAFSLPAKAAQEAPVVGPGIKAATYHYTAITEAKTAKQGSVVAGKLNWRCRGNRCTISGPWPTPGVSACHKLAEKVGRIRSYGHPGKKLDSGQLAACNKGIAGVPGKATVQTAPRVGGTAVRKDQGKIRTGDLPEASKRLGKVILPRPGGGAVQPPEGSTSTGQGSNRRITTARISAVATGRSLSVGGSSSLSLRTPVIRAAGTGQPLAAPARASLAIRTPTIRATATGRLP